MAQPSAYELKRLENIKRNQEILASLNIRSKLSELAASAKQLRAKTKSYNDSPKKKAKSETPVVIRRSLRTRGIAPDPSLAAGLKVDFDEAPNKREHCSPTKVICKAATISMKDAYAGSGAGEHLIDAILGLSKNSDVSKDSTCLNVKSKPRCSVDLKSMKLEANNVARVVPGKILNLRFFPTEDMTMVIVGNNYGNVGFWKTDTEEDEGVGIHLYEPHSGPISGIAIEPYSLSKVFTSCYDGFIKLLDVEKELFDLLYSCDEAIYSIAQQPENVSSLYFCEGSGALNIWDVRAGKSSSVFDLHERRINTIDFNLENINIMATSSTDGTACVWDLRYLDADKSKSLQTVRHARAVHSAYFSPSGKYLATTSMDNEIGISSGVNYQDISTVPHNNQTSRWISSFRGIWGWDDSYIFIGNMKRGVDVVSISHGSTVATLQSEYVTAIPCRFAAHPFQVGTLAGATSGGQVYVWMCDA